MKDDQLEGNEDQEPSEVPEDTDMYEDPCMTEEEARALIDAYEPSPEAINQSRGRGGQGSARVPNLVLLKDELLVELSGPPDSQLRRILDSADSEDLLTWNIFAPLRKLAATSRWVPALLRAGFGRDLAAAKQDFQVRLWHGRRTKEYYPPQVHNEWLKSRMLKSGIQSFVERAGVGRRLEGPTEVDIVLESKESLMFIEAKYLSDISSHTSYDLERDQIARNIDVGTYQAAKFGKEFYFLMLTPSYFERARLYWYKMQDYRSDADLLRRALPHRATGEFPMEFEGMRGRIGWLLWPDLVALWQHALDPLPAWLAAGDVSRVAADFAAKGLTTA